MTKRDWWPEEFKTMVAIGESLTAGGWTSVREHAWVSVLASLISQYQSAPVACFNSGIGANVLSTRSPAYEFSGKPAASERLQKHIFDHHPDLVIFAYGLNDARGNTPLPQYLEYLTELVRQLKQSTGALVVLPGIYYMTDFPRGDKKWGHGSLELFHQFNTTVCETAAREDCLFVDLLAANGGTDWMLHSDGVHANDLGHRIIANAIFQVLAQNCSGLSLHTKALELTSPRWRDESALKADYGYSEEKK